jgi:hypothetical protein
VEKEVAPINLRERGTYAIIYTYGREKDQAIPEAARLQPIFQETKLWKRSIDYAQTVTKTGTT